MRGLPPYMLTICTPCHPAHLTTLDRAVVSVEAQTVPCEHRVLIDEDSRGTGYTRNRLLERVTTPYVAFLDADDWLEPDFAEVCLQAMPEKGYVYTDWYETHSDGIRVVEAPDKPWCAGPYDLNRGPQNGLVHLVTCVMRTEDARRVGGFDEQLPALEDADFYLKLSMTYICPKRINKPLLHYAFSPEGRSQTAKSNGLERAVYDRLLMRYKGMAGCCGDTQPNLTPQGERVDGDVYAMALWHGNRKHVGVPSRRVYPYMSYPMTTWVDPRDVQRNPKLWREVEVPTLSQLPLVMDDNGQQLTGLEALRKAMLDNGVINPVQLVEPGQYTPDFDGVMKRVEGRL